MFPAANDIIGDGVEVVSGVFVTVIVVVTRREAIRSVRAGRSPRKICSFKISVSIAK
jgi:hypothetical protein